MKLRDLFAKKMKNKFQTRWGLETAQNSFVITLSFIFATPAAVANVSLNSDPTACFQHFKMAFKTSDTTLKT
jgi:hypothetical protein